MENNENSTLFEQAVKHLENKEYTLAIVSFTEALQKGYYDSKLHYYLALCYSNMKYYKEALEEIELAFKEDLEFAVKLQLLQLKGYIYFILEENETALAVFTEAAEFDENNKIILSGIAYYYFKNKDYKKAFDYYEKAYNTAPESPSAMNNYGYLMMMNNESLAKAVELCRTALKKQPDNPNIIDSIAWGNYLLDNIKAAALAITKAFKIGAHIEDIKTHYSEIAGKVRTLISKEK